MSVTVRINEKQEQATYPSSPSNSWLISEISGNQFGQTKKVNFNTLADAVGTGAVTGYDANLYFGMDKGAPLDIKTLFHLGKITGLEATRVYDSWQGAPFNFTGSVGGWNLGVKRSSVESYGVVAYDNLESYSNGPLGVLDGGYGWDGVGTCNSTVTTDTFSDGVSKYMSSAGELLRKILIGNNWRALRIGILAGYPLPSQRLSIGICSNNVGISNQGTTWIGFFNSSTGILNIGTGSYLTYNGIRSSQKVNGTLDFTASPDGIGLALPMSAGTSSSTRRWYFYLDIERGTPIGYKIYSVATSGQDFTKQEFFDGLCQRGGTTLRLKGAGSANTLETAPGTGIGATSMDSICISGTLNIYAYGVARLVDI